LDFTLFSLKMDDRKFEEVVKSTQAAVLVLVFIELA